MSKPLFIFDFDGTLADTKKLIIEIGDRYATEIGAKLLSEEDVELYREEGAIALMKKRGFSAIDVIRLLKRGSEMFAERSGSVKLIDGIAEAVSELEKKGVVMTVVTSNTELSVRKVLDDLAGSFAGIFPEKDLFGKAAKLKKVLSRMKADPRNVFYIGDEPRDMLAAVKAGIHPVGVTWGFGSERSLVSAGAERIIHTPDELKKIGGAL